MTLSPLESILLIAGLIGLSMKLLALGTKGNDE